jgi:S-adenosyl-L-methionine hydrolase (adenosine-forming)
MAQAGGEAKDAASMIVLFTDFGLEGPYIGQMKARILREAPAIPIVDLFADAPTVNPKAAAYLLAAYAREFGAGTVFLAVVDPGVGSERPGVIVEADGRWYVGPGNGLFELIARRAATVRKWALNWEAARVSATFHGRDVFAPIVARIACGWRPVQDEQPRDWNTYSDWPDDLAEIVYIDHYGNAMTGLREGFVNPSFVLKANHVYLKFARTFADVPPGEAFWYINANGLVEIAVNQGSAADKLGIGLGTRVDVGEGAAGSGAIR